MCKLLLKVMNDNLLNQSNIAKKLGVSKQYISQILNNKRNLPNTLLNKLTSLYPDSFADKVEIDSNYLIKLRKSLGISQNEIAIRLKTSQSLIAKIEKGERTITDELKERIQLLSSHNSDEVINTAPLRRSDVFEVTYLPNTYLPADNYLDYSVKEHIVIDKRILMTNKNIQVQPNKCLILNVSGGSLTPLYYEGDKFILDTSFTHLKSDCAFAFVIRNQCYIRRITILPDRIKCTSICDERDAFYLQSEKDVKILGLILPRIRF